MSVPMHATIWELLRSATPGRPAIGAPGRPSLHYGALATLAERTVQQLNDSGLGRGDRVAIVLPNGPEMAASFLAIAYLTNG